MNHFLKYDEKLNCLNKKLMKIHANTYSQNIQAQL
jgi:hypothetical protein